LIELSKPTSGESLWLMMVRARSSLTVVCGARGYLDQFAALAFLGRAA